MLPLAQSSTPTGQILLWVFVLIVVIVVGGLAVLELRRRLLSKDRGSMSAGLMDEMRTMHARGELSDEEYDRVRKRMAARAAGRDPDEFAPATKMPEQGEVRARPGFDLTGAPLPAEPKPEDSAQQHRPDEREEDPEPDAKDRPVPPSE